MITKFLKNYAHFGRGQSICNTSLQNLTTFGYCVKIILSAYNIILHIYLYNRGCTNPGCQVAKATKFCMVAPNTCGSSVWNLLHVTQLASRILRWLLEFWKFCAPVSLFISQSVQYPQLQEERGNAVQLPLKENVPIILSYFQNCWDSV